MHDPRFESPLTDAALDREIEQLLAVDPGPGFATRVRARIAHDERTSRRPWSFRPLAIAATVAAIVASAWYVGRVPLREPGVTPSRSGPAVDPQRGPAIADAGRVPYVGRVPRSGPAGDRYVGRVPLRATRPTDPLSPFVPVTSEELALPPVLIGADEQRAIASLLGRRPPEPDRAAAAEPGLDVADLPALDDIAVAGIDVRPLAQMARLEGDRP